MRHHRVLVLAALVGAVTGLLVAGFDWLTQEQVFERVLEAPLGVQAVAPLVGLVLAAVALRVLGGGASAATSDEYIANFHEPERRLASRPVWGRVVGAVSTLGLGGALGYEGPSLYLGASVGSAVQARWSRLFSREENKVLMVAGAAAGVAAIFKAPATGAVFALEVPYQDDTARHMLLPALVGSVAGYLSFVAVVGTAPLFDIEGSPPFDLRDLGGAALLGLLCGAGARGFALLLKRAKRLSTTGRPFVRIAVAGCVMAVLLMVSHALFGESLAIGSGYTTLDWISGSDDEIGLILALLAIRSLASSATVAGGGVGGVFIPLVVAGALVGDAIAAIFGVQGSLFPVIGVAAFLGAGYRTPLAGVMFVAETTGRPGFVVPGLIASVVAQLVMGRVSVSDYQRSSRAGHLERRLALPVTAALRADVLTVPADSSIEDFYQRSLLVSRSPEAPVLEGNTYLGMVSIRDLRRVPVEHWSTTSVLELTDRDRPVVGPDWVLGQAVQAMEQADVDMLAVVGRDNGFVGALSVSEILQLGEVLDQAGAVGRASWPPTT